MAKGNNAPKRPKLEPYPEHQGYRSGCKVCFYYYTDEAVARQASEIAQRNGRIREDQGYDTGYRAAGELTAVKEGEHAGMWEVVIP